MSAGTSASSARAVVSWSGPDQEGLAHVGDVEQAGVLARPVVLGEDAGRVLHRHVVAGERHHAGAERDVLALERRRQERLVGAASGRPSGHRVLQSRARSAADSARSRPLCPGT